MDKQEFLLLIPAIIYGVAIVDLLKVFGHRKNDWDMVAWGITIMLSISYSWILLYSKLEKIASDNIFFLMVIVQAIITAQIASTLTPETKDEDTKSYFFDKRKTFFSLLLLSNNFNQLMQQFVFDDHVPLYYRLPGIILFTGCIFINKIWIRVLTLIIFFIIVGMVFLN